jgi:hypothetical protein
MNVLFILIYIPEHFLSQSPNLGNTNLSKHAMSKKLEPFVKYTSTTYVPPWVQQYQVPYSCCDRKMPARQSSSDLAWNS